jgi:phosphoribosylaminoimidazolecarboxamide formyltransferase/IMP cyclohydrolase
MSHNPDLKPAAVAPRPVAIRRALISVSDKTGLTGFAKGLQRHGAQILSTGGTAKGLKADGLDVTDVSAYTGFPEIMDGRVKTLHPKVHGGLLARRDDAGHRSAMEANGIEGIDLLVVNLYPFVKVIAQGADFPTAIENIDIGGPAMVRAAAKNHDYVAVVTDPADYERVLAELDTHKGAVSHELRRELAAKAFATTAAYDSAIARWFSGQLATSTEAGLAWPASIEFRGALKQSLRYGENPHQTAALYSDGSNRPGVATARQLQGKELSYNNLNDTDAAFELAAEFDEPAIAIIKHANPCGVATAATLAEAYALALRCDPVSAFGGIVAMNRPLDAETAAAIAKIFSEVIIAPVVTPEALEILKKKTNLRVLETGRMPDRSASRRLVKSIAGGLLVQDADTGAVQRPDLKIVTKRAPTDRELEDMLFAFRVAKHVKSNAIVYAKDHATVGIGAGQMSRIDSTVVAARKSEEAAKSAGLETSLAQGSVVASDAFFPFADGLLAAAEAGATAVIQPGGSVRDADVIAAADEKNIAMVFTGMRHFRH